MALLKYEQIPTLLSNLGWFCADVGIEKNHQAFNGQLIRYWYSFRNNIEDCIRKDAEIFACRYKESPKQVCFLFSQKTAIKAILIAIFRDGSLAGTSHAIMVGDNLTCELVEDIAQRIKQVYYPIIIRSLVLEVQNLEIALTASIHKWFLNCEITTELDVRCEYLDYLSQCHEKLERHLRRLSAVDSKLAYQSLSAIAKYKALMATRISPEEIEKLVDYDLCQKILSFDITQKNKIYSENMKIEECLRKLSLSQSLCLLSLEKKQAIDEMCQRLKDHEFVEMLRWEKILQNRIAELSPRYFFYLWNIGLQFCKDVYNFSLIRFGSDLVSNLTVVLSKKLLFPVSPEVLERHFYVVKCVGATLGATGMYILGRNTCFHSVLLAVVSKSVIKCITKISLNDHAATRSTFLPERFGAIQVASILTSTIEALYIGSAPILIQSCGAVLGSIVMIKLTKRAMLKNLKRSPSESEVIALMSISMIGTYFGRLTIDYIYLGFNKILVRNALEKLVCKSAQDENRLGCTVYFPISKLRWQFWASNRDNLRMSWTSRDKYLEYDCEDINFSENSYIANCKVISDTSVLRIGH